MKNNNCDGAGPCSQGPVRLLPLGKIPDHGNLILCRQCFHREIEFRRQRNKELALENQFSLPTWESLQFYNS